ncbi:1,3-beta-galactosyl-N-acetylhexosamine phosphorylase C-terminal domain-containing protein [Proteiniclasticum sp.]
MNNTDIEQETAVYDEQGRKTVTVLAPQEIRWMEMEKNEE